MTAGGFSPKIVAFLCSWCSYAGADKAGSAQLPWPAGVHVIRVMCSGRVDPVFVVEALRQGADGVLILACHPGDCHYKEGNYRTAHRAALLHRYLAQFQIEPARLRFDYVSAGEGEKFARVVNAMQEDIRRMGPLEVKLSIT